MAGRTYYLPKGRKARKVKEFTQLLSRADFASLLYFLRVVQFGEFPLKAHRDPRWKDMDLSPFFINLRKEEHGGPLMAHSARWIGQQVGLGICMSPNYKLSASIRKIDFITGIPRAGVDLALGFRDVWGEDILFLEMEKPEGKKEAGIQLLTDVSGLTICRGIVVDDVVTNAASKVEAKAELAKYGLEVATFAIVLDRESGGAEEMAKLDIPLYAHLGLAEVLGIYEDTGFITEETMEKCLGYGAYMEEYQRSHP